LIAIPDRGKLGLLGGGLVDRPQESVSCIVSPPCPFYPSRNGCLCSLFRFGPERTNDLGLLVYPFKGDSKWVRSCMWVT
jgi:hypothetical protein